MTDRTQDEALIAAIRSGKLQQGVCAQATNRLEALIAKNDALVAALERIAEGGFASRLRRIACEALTKHGGRS